MDRKSFHIISILVLCLSCSKPYSDTHILNISVPHQLDTLDPHAKDKLSNFAIISNFYEGLVRMDTNMRVQPGLATSWETRDANTWVFHLEKDVTFHSGKEMTADDVVYSLERVITNPQLEVHAYVSGIREVKSLDSRTILIRTDDPASGLPNRLCFVMIVPAGSDGKRLDENVDGTGPFSLQKWEKGLTIQMFSWEKYWKTNLPRQTVRFYLNRTIEESVRDANSSRFQLVQSRSRKLQNGIQGQHRMKLLRRDSLFLKYLGFDVSNEMVPGSNEVANPFQSLSVRKAIHLAIDRKAFQEKLATSVSPASQPVPPFVFGANPEIQPPIQDLQAALSLLRDAGFPDGFRCTLLAREILQETALVVRNQLKQVGIHVDLKLLPDPDFFAELRRGNANFYLSQFGCLTGDALELQDVFLSRSPSGMSGSRNYGGYSNPNVDRLMMESRQILSQEKRRANLQEILSILMKDLPWVPLYIDQDMYAVDRSLSWEPRYDGFLLAEEMEFTGSRNE